MLDQEPAIALCPQPVVLHAHQHPAAPQLLTRHLALERHKTADQRRIRSDPAISPRKAPLAAPEVRSADVIQSDALAVGDDLRSLPLSERKERLKKHLGNTDSSEIRYVDPFSGGGGGMPQSARVSFSQDVALYGRR